MMYAFEYNGGLKFVVGLWFIVAMVGLSEPALHFKTVNIFRRHCSI